MIQSGLRVTREKSSIDTRLNQPTGRVRVLDCPSTLLSDHLEHTFKCLSAISDACLVISVSVGLVGFSIFLVRITKFWLAE